MSKAETLVSDIGEFRQLKRVARVQGYPADADRQRWRNVRGIMFNDRMIIDR